MTHFCKLMDLPMEVREFGWVWDWDWDWVTLGSPRVTLGSRLGVARATQGSIGGKCFDCNKQVEKAGWAQELPELPKSGNCQKLKLRATRALLRYNHPFFTWTKRCLMKRSLIAFGTFVCLLAATSFAQSGPCKISDHTEYTRRSRNSPPSRFFRPTGGPLAVEFLRAGA